MAERGLFIVLEGGEGSGKGMQAELLKQRYAQAGLTLTLAREPGGTKWGEGIRRLLLGREGDEVIDPVAEILAFYSSRRQLLAEIVGPSLEKGTDVLLDRFHLSSCVYQGMVRKLGVEVISTLSDLVVVRYGLTPDLCVVLDIPVEVGLGRKHGQGGDEVNFFEKQAREFHYQVREGYRAAVRMSKEGKLNLAYRMEEIDANQSPEAVHTIIIDLIEQVREEKLGIRRFATA